MGALGLQRWMSAALIQWGEASPLPALGAGNTRGDEVPSGVAGSEVEGWVWQWESCQDPAASQGTHPHYALVGEHWASLTHSSRAPHWQQGPSLDSRVQLSPLMFLLQPPAGPASIFREMELYHFHIGNVQRRARGQGVNSSTAWRTIHYPIPPTTCDSTSGKTERGICRPRLPNAGEVNREAASRGSAGARPPPPRCRRRCPL